MGAIPLAALSFLISSCGEENSSPEANAPVDGLSPGSLEKVTLIDAPPTDSSLPLFEKIPVEKSGVTFSNNIVNEHPLKHLFATEKAAGGIAIGDVDGDGKPDLFFTSGPESNRLYRQVENFRFEDITEEAGISGGGAWSVGASMADIDGDGDLDCYVANYDSPNQLFINDGSARFSEQGEESGLAVNTASHMPTFVDYDGDGDLDCYLMTNQFHSPTGTPPAQEAIKFESINGKLHVNFSDPGLGKYFRIEQSGLESDGSPNFSLKTKAQPDYLMRNNGDGTFTDVTEKAGIAGTGRGLSATWWDIDGDGAQDLWVGNDFQYPDRVYRNNRDGTFTDVVLGLTSHTTWFSMGADFADVDGDGLTDFLIADMSGSNHFKQKVNMGAMGAMAEFLKTANPPQYMRNALFVNTGTRRFLEAAQMAGLANTDWTWSVKLCDFDNDSRPDVFFTNGMTRNFNESDNAAVARRSNETEWDRHLRAGTAELREQNLTFKNMGDLQFEDVSAKWGLDHTGMSFACAHADLDGDGNLDLVVGNVGEPATIYRNRGTAGNHKALVELRGNNANTMAIGARVTLEAGETNLHRELTLARGYLSSNQAILHFGLGSADKIDRLTIHWPGGGTDTFTDLPTDHRFIITQGKAATKMAPVKKNKPFHYQLVDSFEGARHVENDFDDFEKQSLLPNQLSRLGPGQAWGDIDGDGDDDLWMGGASGSSGRIMRNDKDGKFTPIDSPALSNDSKREDMGGLWIDADNDDDLDLYVVSGGYEFEPGSPELLDRLYLNDGKGSLSPAPADSLPNLRSSGGTVAAADFDRDGDLDLFTGGRVVPGEYPVTPESALLRNDGGKFTDITDTVPTLKTIGMVTSALWSDSDGNGWPDLLITLEWGSVRLFANNDGKLSDQSEGAGLSKYTGWWNGIAGRDLDGDGDIDYAVTNFGLNTKYHASPAHPTSLYYGDFEKTGRRYIVEAEFEDDILYPVRGRSCSTRAMPSLGKKFDSFKGFALAELTEIYQPAKLEDSLRFEATELSSGVFLNDGKGRFAFKPLPRLAQTAPGFGIVFSELNGDANPDIYLAQNFFSPQVETGRMAGGVSLLLAGQGDSNFEPVRADISGLVVGGDAKSLTHADLDGDGLPDFSIGQNNDRYMGFLTKNTPKGTLSAIRLVGTKGNRNAAGSRITAILDDGTKQSTELYAGGGYLSQNPPEAVFGTPAGRKLTSIEITWPDGQSTKHSLPADRHHHVISRD